MRSCIGHFAPEVAVITENPRYSRARGLGLRQKQAHGCIRLSLTALGHRRVGMRSKVIRQTLRQGQGPATSPRHLLGLKRSMQLPLSCSSFLGLFSTLMRLTPSLLAVLRHLLAVSY